MAKRIEYIKISDIQLSLTNPRFTFLNNFNQDLIGFIKKENNGEYSEEKAAEQLLGYEGDLKDLKSLVSSVIRLGFEDLGESILVVKHEDKYIVAEGNRRVLVLKLLSGLIKFPEAELISNGKENVQDLNHNIEPEFQTNYNWLKKNIDDFVESKTPIKNITNSTIETTVIDKSDELWRLIYTKHIVGDRPGMRKWSRGKYFVDILNFFPSGIDLNDDDTNLILIKNIQREPKTVARDYFEAQFVRDILLSPDNNLESAYTKMMNSKVSALQSTFSLKNVRETAKKELNISKENFNKLFSIGKTKTGVIKYSGTIGKADILNLIFEFFANKTLTTRAIKSEDYINFAKRVRMVFSGVYFDVDEKIDEEEALKINAFNLSAREIDKVLASSPDLPKDTRERFIFSKDIMENDKKIKEELESTFSSRFTKEDPAFVFSTLKDQLVHNTTPREFLNAAALSLRALHEQIVVWGSYFVEEALNVKYPGVSFEAARDSLANELAKGSIGDMFGALHQKIKKPLISSEVIDGFAGEKVSDPKYSQALTRLRNKTVNAGIHASHRVYNIKNYLDFLKGIKEFQDDIFLVLDIIDERTIVELSDKIKSKL